MVTVFGILNLTEDSFFDESRRLDPLMRLTEDVPDVRQELLNRLLSGKKLTGRDEQDIRRLWQDSDFLSSDGKLRNLSVRA